MHNDKESPFTLTLLDDDLSLQVVQFSGHEALNQPYRFDIEVLGLAPALPLERFLQQPVLLSLGHGPGIHGVLNSVSREHRGPRRVAYKLVLVPALQALDRYRSRRVFAHLSVPMILRQLLVEHDLPDSSYRFELPTGHYPLRPFCIQYDETDLALLQRLCEEEGIHYHFEHYRDAHVLVFAEDCLSFPQEPLMMPFDSDAPDAGNPPTISELFQRHDAPSMSQRPDTRNRGAEGHDDRAANHPFAQTMPPVPRPPIEQCHRDQLARRHLERLRCQQVQIHGQSNHDQLRSANIVQVAEHPRPGFNDQWLVTEVRHQGRQGSILASDTSDLLPRYRNQFTAIPWSTVFRPRFKQTRPSIPGYQLARVCGQVGQPTTLDERGLIQVSLWPAPDADPEDFEGLWIPIALAASDNRIDLSQLPLAGSDGLVSFLDGDADRPVFCASQGEPHTPAPVRCREPRSDTRLLLDWLTKPTDTD
ncbi:type VI secretion system tip protein VgrG [Pseudomonas sp. PCH199]|uniref:type VI secretion system Vgr family protein n=1 Tax=unclassified Pseudomonas TaxID=196821 RepID=UPI000BD83D5E|nr:MULTISPECIES: type VI secretion system tip protein TssI/VgrG [unclassified Pseudomonas]MCW8277815.1 type VI secretion system tip protein VgrG [Pseudomonas sp. PCH199]PAM81976.1 type IV secretion protein Rhs [Pseudomonas sp. ERMR1:02]